MNQLTTITIEQLGNGWMVTLKQGQGMLSKFYEPTFDAVLVGLNKMNDDSKTAALAAQEQPSVANGTVIELPGRGVKSS